MISFTHVAGRPHVCDICGLEWRQTPAGAVFLTPMGPSTPLAPEDKEWFSCCGERFRWVSGTDPAVSAP